MFEKFESYFKEHTNLTNAEFKLMYSKASKLKVRKKEILLRAGEVCRFKFFVVSGMLRTYSMSANGSEHILMFSTENNWSTEPESLDNLTPSRFYIDAVENSEVIQWSKADFNELQEIIPQLKAYSQKIISRNIYLNRQRIASTLSSSVEERYDDFIKTNPDVMARIPLQMVASYLGVSLKTLSRIRHAQVKR